MHLLDYEGENTPTIWDPIINCVPLQTGLFTRVSNGDKGLSGGCRHVPLSGKYIYTGLYIDNVSDLFLKKLGFLFVNIYVKASALSATTGPAFVYFWVTERNYLRNLQFWAIYGLSVTKYVLSAYAFLVKVMEFFGAFYIPKNEWPLMVTDSSLDRSERPISWKKFGTNNQYYTVVVLTAL